MIERSYYPGTNIQFEALKREYDELNTEYIFTSLQLNNDSEGILDELSRQGYKIITDVSKNTLKNSGKSIEALYEKYPDIICRLDDGYSDGEVLSLAERFHIIVNASTVGENLLRGMDERHQISAMFNYYPKPLTGMTGKDVQRIVRRMHQSGVKVYGFIPGTAVKRGPVHYGLPTIESHRRKSILHNYMCLKALNVDRIFLGDEYLTPAEVGRLNELKENRLTLRVQTNHPEIFEQMNRMNVSIRPDGSEYLHRFSSTRGKMDEFMLETGRKVNVVSAGDILIDGSEVERYAGEVQIVCKDSGASGYPWYKIGELLDKDLIPYIKVHHIIQFEQEPDDVFSDKTH